VVEKLAYAPMQRPMEDGYEYARITGEGGTYSGGVPSNDIAFAVFRFETLLFVAHDWFVAWGRRMRVGGQWVVRGFSHDLDECEPAWVDVGKKYGRLSTGRRLCMFA
jgi:hypothetical protein